MQWLSLHLQSNHGNANVVETLRCEAHDEWPAWQLFWWSEVLEDTLCCKSSRLVLQKLVSNWLLLQKQWRTVGQRIEEQPWWPNFLSFSFSFPVAEGYMMEIKRFSFYKWNEFVQLSVSSHFFIYNWPSHSYHAIWPKHASFCIFVWMDGPILVSIYVV